MRSPVGPRQLVLTDIKCVRAAFDRVQGGRNILRPSDFKRVELESEHTGRRLQLAQLQHDGRITDIAHDRQTAQALRMASRNRSSRFPARSTVSADRPVTFPPGRARLPTRPELTGSPAAANTIGTAGAACFAAKLVARVPPVTMMSTLIRENSAAISAKRSLRASAQRYSIAIVRPSIQPRSWSRRANAAARSFSARGVLSPKKPTIGRFTACCARAASGHAAAAPPSNVMNSRHRMGIPSVRGSTPYHIVEKPCCASQHFGPPDFRNGSLASEAIGAGGQSMSQCLQSRRNFVHRSERRHVPQPD